MFCENCGKEITPGAKICGYCGTPVTAYEQSIQTPVQLYKQSGSYNKLWWLLPIFVGVIGGLIAFFGVRKRSTKAAVIMLVVGIISTIIGYFLFGI
ncbi:MAG TPA: zinc-ribbon domain-containing protein [Nitrososphaerales archaeon]|nr:zinc-ribbon domain-containing protein [Nitrososphaerales archaeon]